MKYLLMNKNTKVALLEYNSETKQFSEIYDIYNLEFAPLQLINSEKSKTESTIKALNHWFKGRGIPNWRKDIERLLEKLNLSSTDELLDKAYGLSLSDQYWIKEENEDIEWKDINFFENNFDYKGFLNATFSSSNSYEEVSLITPNNTTDGMISKAWVIEDNKRVLIKGSYSSLNQEEPFNEWLASQISERLNLQYCDYKIDVIDKKIVSKCENFLTSNEEIITAYNIFNSEKKDNNTNDFTHYLNILKKHNVPYALEDLQDMFFVDYLIMNTDRHMNNYGIIRNVETLEWERLTPIFDSGQSMNCDKPLAYMNFYNGEGKFFYNTNKKFSEYLEYIDVNKYDLSPLKDLPDKYRQILKEYQIYTDISDERIEKLATGLEQRIGFVREYKEAVVPIEDNDEDEEDDDWFEE